MLDFDFERMLFKIPPNEHTNEEIAEILKAHPEVQFVSMVGLDIAGHCLGESPRLYKISGKSRRDLGRGGLFRGRHRVLHGVRS